MSFLPYPTNNLVVRTVSSLPAKARKGTVVFDSSDGFFYVFLNGVWIQVPTLKIHISQGQPIGLMGVTYANDVS